MQVHNSSPLGVKDIDATLKHGAIFTSKLWLALCMTMWSSLGMMILICVFGLIFAPAEDDWLFILLVCLGMSLVTLLLFLMLNWGKWQVKKYLKDAVILKAITKKAGEGSVGRSGIAMGTAIQVRFSYMKKRYVKNSLDEKKDVWSSVAFNRYVDKELLIAYSPKYDHVMLIKPKSERRIWTEHYESERTKGTP